MDLEAAVKALDSHLATTFGDFEVERRADAFHRDGFVKFGADQPLIPGELLESVDEEVHKLVREHTERRDLRLRTTGNTPRRMSVVRSEEIERSSELIAGLAAAGALLGFMARVAREPVIASVSDDERFLITHQEHAGDTHGWHWGDYSFALIWALRMPPVSHGGMLQCVPHTHWDKSDPRVNEILCERRIDTHGLASGDVYFLRTDTTLHRTVPLTEDGRRTILNMTWAGERDRRKALHGDDRWWEDATASAARRDD